MTSPRKRLPPLNALRAFEASARHLNFRLAADELNVTQSAVAQQVRALEADLGAKLFDRLPRSLALTSIGRAYANNLTHAFALIVDATTAIRPEPQRLTISVTPTFAAKWLLPRLPGFAALHPDIELRIMATEALATFQSDGVDIAVRQAAPPFRSNLVADLLFEQEIIAICSPTLVPEGVTPFTPQQLDTFTLLHDAHDLWPEYVERVLGRRLSPSTKQVRFSQTALAIDAALTGQGIALAGRFLVEQELSSGRLTFAFAGSMHARSNFYIVRPKKPRDPVATDKVSQWLLSCR